MIYLLLSILCSSAIFVVFKLFNRFRIDTFQAIVFNYFVASAFGFKLVENQYSITEIVEKKWFIYAIIIGVLFILLFNLIAITSQRIGVSVASVATKMSLIIPVIFLVLTNSDETLGPLKSLGILFAIAGVWFSTTKDKTAVINTSYALFPISLLIGSGVLDLLIAYSQKHLFTSNLDDRLFVPIPFLISALLGTFIILIQLILKKTTLKLKNLIAGMVLGFLNYGSIYFLIKTYSSNILESSSVIPINNMAIVALSALAAYFLFKEKMRSINQFGIALSIIAIALIMFAG